jgi:hypothetical protein
MSGRLRRGRSGQRGLSLFIVQKEKDCLHLSGGLVAEASVDEFVTACDPS